MATRYDRYVGRRTVVTVQTLTSTHFLSIGTVYDPVHTYEALRERASGYPSHGWGWARRSCARSGPASQARGTSDSKRASQVVLPYLHFCTVVCPDHCRVCRRHRSGIVLPALHAPQSACAARACLDTTMASPKVKHACLHLYLCLRVYSSICICTEIGLTVVGMRCSMHCSSWWAILRYL